MISILSSLTSSYQNAIILRKCNAVQCIYSCACICVPSVHFCAVHSVHCTVCKYIWTQFAVNTNRPKCNGGSITLALMLLCPSYLQVLCHICTAFVLWHLVYNFIAAGLTMNLCWWQGFSSISDSLYLTEQNPLLLALCSLQRQFMSSILCNWTLLM